MKTFCLTQSSRLRFAQCVVLVAGNHRSEKVLLNQAVRSLRIFLRDAKKALARRAGDSMSKWLKDLSKVLSDYKWVLLFAFIMLLALPPLIARMGPVKTLKFEGSAKGIIVTAVSQDIKVEERRYVEQLPIRPADHITNIAEGIIAGIDKKIALLTAKVYLAEAQVVLTGGLTVPEKVLKQSSLSDRLRSYAVDGNNTFSVLKGLASRIEQHQQLATLLQRSRFFELLRGALAVTTQDERNRFVRLAMAEATQKESQSIGVGTLYNMLGNLAISTGDTNLAFKFLYEAYHYDNEHLPTLESLSFALWKFNADCRTAIRFSRDGYQLARTQVLQVPRDKLDTLSALKSLEQQQPSLAALTAQRIVEVSHFYSTTEEKIHGYLEGFYHRLEDIAAYCMAYERTDEAEARRLADALLAAAPEDPDYLDTKGFVVMRFSQSAGEVSQAVTLFRQAVDSSKGDQQQRELATHHLNLASTMQQKLK